MWMMPSSVKIYLATRPVDFRCGFDRLATMVRGVLRADPASGHLFVFRNRRETQVKVLFFDRTGYVILHKRLEAGTFRLPRAPEAGATHLDVDASELGLMLEGLVLDGAQQRRRWRRAAA